jgi:hypothetical protein
MPFRATLRAFVISFDIGKLPVRGAHPEQPL